jgi:hypothetical protein
VVVSIDLQQQGGKRLKVDRPFQVRGISGWGKLVSAVLGALMLTLLAGVVSATAEAPTVTIGTPTGPTYTTVQVTGEVDPKGEPTSWGFEVSTDGANWQETNLSGFSEATGAESVGGQIEGLKAGATYQVRLSATNLNDFTQVFSAEPNPEFTTDALPPPTVSIDPVTTFTATTAHLSGSVNSNAPVGNPSAADVHWHFECSLPCSSSGGTVSAGASDTVEETITGLEPNTAYEVVLVGSNAGGPVSSAPTSFTTDAVVPKAVTIPAFALGDGTSALLGARINPQNSPTTYWFEFGLTTSYSQSEPSAQDADAGAGGQAEFQTLRVGGLAPGTVYHYRVVAENPVDRVVGEDMTFKTPPAPSSQGCPNAVLRSENNSTSLPDCRAYEMVSPPKKNGNDVGFSDNSPVYVAAADGNALAFESLGALPEAQSANGVNQNLSVRGAGGWSTKPINSQVPAADNTDFPEFSHFTPNLDRGVIVNPPGLHLAPGDVGGAYNLYLRDNRDDTYRTLSGPVTAGPDPERIVFYGESADSSHVAFEADAALTPEAPVPSEAPSNLYERADGELRLVSVLPNGDPAPYGVARLATAMIHTLVHTVSEDGSKIVFQSAGSGAEPDEEQIYLREDGERTVQVSASQRSIPDLTSTTVPVLWGSSADGSKVIFTSQKALTDDAEPGETNLYRFHVEGGVLENLTVNHNPDDQGSTASGVLGISEDASYVYFQSPSVFVPGQGEKGASNLYLWHDGEISYVATANVGDFGTTNIMPRVSPNGHYLAFAAAERLTAYDNTDALTGAPDSEVYLYDAGADRLTCASCRPSGGPPSGGSGLPIPPIRQPNNRQRTVLDDGTVFFDSADVIVRADSNGLQDVYEMREGRVALISSGISADISAFVGASEDGRDAFFSTRDPLAPADVDENRDVYDARIGGGFPAQREGAEVCSGDECQGQMTPPPAAAPPASAHLKNPPQAKKHKKCKASKRAKGKKKHCKGRKSKTRKGGSR